MKSDLIDWGSIAFACVDPGLRGCGVAVFDAGKLAMAAYVKNPVTFGRGYDAHIRMGAEVYLVLSRWETNIENPAVLEALVIEFPQIYGNAAAKKGDENDLLDLAGVGAAIAYPWRNSFPIYSPHPRDWKGQVPKEKMTKRIAQALEHDEKSRIGPCPASLMHNVLDACGIGLWKLNRLNRKVIHND